MKNRENTKNLKDIPMNNRNNSIKSTCVLERGLKIEHFDFLTHKANSFFVSGKSGMALKTHSSKPLHGCLLNEVLVRENAGMIVTKEGLCRYAEGNACKA